MRNTWQKIRPRRVACAVVAALLLGACASGGARQGILSGGPVPELKPLLTVTNNGSQRVEVFAVLEESGAPIRLGAVQANFTKILALPWTGRTMHLLVRPVSGTEQPFRTLPFAAREGGDVRLQIRPIRGYHLLRVS